MIVLLMLVILVVLLPLVLGIVIALRRPAWTYMRVALIAAMPIPLLLISFLSYLFSTSLLAGELSFSAVFSGAGFVVILFVPGVMAAAVGAWLAPKRDNLPLREDEIERIFQ